MPLSGALLKGPWSLSEVETYLAEAIVPIRLSVISPTGWPIVLSLWFLCEHDTIVCATQENSSVVAALRQNDRCAFEIAGERPPYRGVRGRGTVRLETEPAGQILVKLVDRYLGSDESPLARWLLGRIETEICIRIDPLTVASWDYSRRMGAA